MVPKDQQLPHSIANFCSILKASKSFSRLDRTWWSSGAVAEPTRPSQKNRFIVIKSQWCNKGNFWFRYFKCLGCILNNYSESADWSPVFFLLSKFLSNIAKSIQICYELFWIDEKLKIWFDFAIFCYKLSIRLYYISLPILQFVTIDQASQAGRHCQHVLCWLSC